MLTTPILPTKICSRTSSRGFTLIEILIVMGIIAVTITLAAPRLLRKDTNIKSVARHFMVLGKEVRNRARLQNTTMRLMIDLDPAAPKYWVEKANGPKLVPTQEEQEQIEKEKEEAKKDGKETSDWNLDTVLTKDKKTLPNGLYFGAVETIHMKAPQTDGVAAIHFFSQGLMEAAMVQITDRKNLTWTLVFNPLTGQADIVEKATTLKEITR